MLRIDQPFHGAVLDHRHGRQTSEGLVITVSGQAACGEVSVNTVPARRTGERFEAEIVLSDTVTEIVAVSRGQTGQNEHRVKVVWDKHSFRRYRFAIDDNIFFLRDIAQKEYDSLFDCFYLEMLRKLHDEYDTRFVLNIYYDAEDGFDLSQFPDRYRGQWQDNSHWLKLAFHAYANSPVRPYQDAPAEKLITDLDKVAEQIHRFAGEETYSPPTIIHWCMAQPSALKLLAERGVRVLSGLFQRHNGRHDCNYFLDDQRSDYLASHDTLMDFDSGIIFSQVDLFCNVTPLDQTVPLLQSLTQAPNRSEIMDLFTHEQYFWPFYQHYLADHSKRLDAAIRFVTENGYKPVFFHESLLADACLEQ